MGSNAAKTFSSVCMCLGLVQVLEIRALPEEALARGALNAARIDVVRVEDRLLLGAEVLAHHGDHAHIGEKTGRQREVSCRAAQAALPPSRRGFNQNRKQRCPLR